MLTRLMKWAALAATLCLVPLAWFAPASTVFAIIKFVVWAGAVVTVVQAARVRRFFWAAAFVIPAIVFNAAVPISLSRDVAVAIDLASAAIFAMALYLMPKTELLTVLSVVDPSPRRASL